MVAANKNSLAINHLPVCIPLKYMKKYLYKLTSQSLLYLQENDYLNILDSEYQAHTFNLRILYSRKISIKNLLCHMWKSNCSDLARSVTFLLCHRGSAERGLNTPMRTAIFYFPGFSSACPLSGEATWTSIILSMVTFVNSLKICPQLSYFLILAWKFLMVA